MKFQNKKPHRMNRMDTSSNDVVMDKDLKKKLSAVAALVGNKKNIFPFKKKTLFQQYNLILRKCSKSAKKQKLFPEENPQ
jgi:hypothetical protein